MERYTIQQSEACSAESCEHCGADIAASMHVRRADSDRPLCRSCGRRYAPAMTALLDLACVAEKVSRCGRRLLTPPMESLLDLARAAEVYSDTSGVCVQAAR